MAFKHGSTTLITLDGNDLSAYTNSSEFSQEVDTHDVTAYSPTVKAKAYNPGLTDSTFSMEGHYDDTASGPKAIIEAIIDAGVAVTLIRQAEGAGTGLPQESVSVIVTSYSESNPVADMITWSCDCQCTGAITRSTQA